MTRACRARSSLEHDSVSRPFTGSPAHRRPLRPHHLLPFPPSDTTDLQINGLDANAERGKYIPLVVDATLLGLLSPELA